MSSRSLLSSITPAAEESETFSEYNHNFTVDFFLFTSLFSLSMPRKTQEKKERPWQDIAQQAQKYRDSTIDRGEPKLPQIPGDLPKNVFSTLRSYLDEQDIKITEMLPEDLLQLLASGEATATSVTTAFLRRASLAQKLVGLEQFGSVSSVPTLSRRPTVSPSFFPNELWPVLNIWMSIS